MRWVWFFGAVGALMLQPGVAGAAPGGVVVEGGGARAMVDVDVAARVVRRRACQGEPCSPGGASEPIAIATPAWLELDLAASRVAAVPIGDGKTVAHVVVPAKDGERAWEAVIAASGAPVFAGPTGYVDGQDGERTGAAVRLVDADGAKVVVVADIREDVRLCNQRQTPLAARGLDPKTMTLRGASLQRLSPEERAAARRVVATARAGEVEPPLARVLRYGGSSAPHGERIADGDPSSVWREERPGDGRGEFVVLRAPSEVALDRFVVTLVPPDAGAHAPSAAPLAAPKSFFLVVGAKAYHVVLPEDAALRPGGSYEVPLPEPSRVGCVAVVLDEAYTRGAPHPEVGVAELTAYTELDHPGAKLDEVARALRGAGARAEAASAVLKRAGAPAIAALVAEWDGLDAPGRALAVDVASSAPSCDVGAPLLVRALGDKDREVERKSRGKLERCGKAASAALGAAVAGSDPLLRARAAPLFALVAPNDAARPLADALSQGDATSRAPMRAAFALAARSLPPKVLLGLLTDPDRSAPSRVDLFRASTRRLPELHAEVAPALARAFAAGEPMSTRYLMLEPLASLLGVAPWAGDLLSAQVARAPEWPVRARAAEVAAGHPDARRALVAAVDDPEPRVREAALRSLGAKPGADATAALERRLTSDPWTFVRVAAALALAASPPDAHVDARLVAALGDASPKVRAEALTALGKRRVTTAGAAIEARARARDEDLEVKRAALTALGATCDRRRVDYLTDVATRLALPMTLEGDVVLGVAAVQALAEIHPPDLERRLAPLRDKTARAEVRRVAEAALAEPGHCR